MPPAINLKGIASLGLEKNLYLKGNVWTLVASGITHILSWLNYFYNVPIRTTWVITPATKFQKWQKNSWLGAGRFKSFCVAFGRWLFNSYTSVDFQFCVVKKIKSDVPLLLLENYLFETINYFCFLLLVWCLRVN